MFGREKRQPVARQAPTKRHGRRPIRSSLTGSHLPNPEGRVIRFELAARSALDLLRSHFAAELAGVQVGFATAPTGTGESEQPMYYSIDRDSKTIVLYRMPIQRAKGLHVDDAEHRRLFIGHCVYRAVCEYLGREPWELLPGYFEHY